MVRISTKNCCVLLFLFIEVQVKRCVSCAANAIAFLLALTLYLIFSVMSNKLVVSHVFRVAPQLYRDKLTEVNDLCATGFLTFEF